MIKMYFYKSLQTVDENQGNWILWKKQKEKEASHN